MLSALLGSIFFGQVDLKFVLLQLKGVVRFRCEKFHDFVLHNMCLIELRCVSLLFKICILSQSFIVTRSDQEELSCFLYVAKNCPLPKVRFLYLSPGLTWYRLLFMIFRSIPGNMLI